MNIDDPVSSLRAAALLTRTTKRLPASEETKTPSSPRQSNYPTPVAILASSRDSGVELVDTADKEEGEISDEEFLPSQSLQTIRNDVIIEDTSLVHQSSPTTPEHVRTVWAQARPNLRMTDEQLWEAKVIILDLLGWGVPPSYLIDCGLSREAIYYVFTELRLKLPEEFNSGRDSQQDKFSNEIRLNTASLDPPSFQGSHARTFPSKRAPSTQQAEQSLGFPSQPQTDTQSPLLEIEQMRRKELLARKAVLASRKLKLQSNSGKTTPKMAENGTGKVDDFLQTITPTELHSLDADSLGLSYEDGTVLQLESTIKHESSSRETLELVPNQSSLLLQSSHLDVARRSSKRPVASDFVEGLDNEQSPQLENCEFTPSAEPQGEEIISRRSTPAANQRIGIQRPKEPNFNKVSILRRCVIDFSDEEDDSLAAERIKTDIALVKAKEEEIRKLRERIERYKGKQPVDAESESNAISNKGVRQNSSEVRKFENAMDSNTIADEGEDEAEDRGHVGGLSDSEAEMDQVAQDVLKQEVCDVLQIKMKGLKGLIDSL